MSFEVYFHWGFPKTISAELRQTHKLSSEPGYILAQKNGKGGPGDIPKLDLSQDKQIVNILRRGGEWVKIIGDGYTAFLTSTSTNHFLNQGDNRSADLGLGKNSVDSQGRKPFYIFVEGNVSLNEVLKKARQLGTSHRRNLAADVIALFTCEEPGEFEDPLPEDKFREEKAKLRNMSSPLPSPDKTKYKEYAANLKASDKQKNSYESANVNSSRKSTTDFGSDKGTLERALEWALPWK
jgi:hypothetical protein